MLHDRKIKAFVRLCIYYKESLGVCIKDIPNLTESILCQVTINNKTGYVLVVYLSPSQSWDDLEYFSLKISDQVITDMNLSIPVFKLVLGDFNCTSNSWRDGNISPKKGIDQVLTNLSPRLMGFASLSQIQQIFFLNLAPGLSYLYWSPNLVTDGGVNSFLLTNCHHQIANWKLNLKMVSHLYMTA